MTTDTLARTLTATLKELHLPTIRALYGERAEAARREGFSYERYLHDLVEEERTVRRQNRIQRLREDSHAIKDSRRLNATEKEIAELDVLLDELKNFTEKVSRLATRGPDPDIQEVEAPYVMDLDEEAVDKLLA